MVHGGVPVAVVHALCKEAPELTEDPSSPRVLLRKREQRIDDRHGRPVPRGDGGVVKVLRLPRATKLVAQYRNGVCFHPKVLCLLVREQFFDVRLLFCVATGCGRSILAHSYTIVLLCGAAAPSSDPLMARGGVESCNVQHGVGSDASGRTSRRTTGRAFPKKSLCAQHGIHVVHREGTSPFLQCVFTRLVIPTHVAVQVEVEITHPVTPCRACLCLRLLLRLLAVERLHALHHRLLREERDACIPLLAGYCCN